MKITIRQLVEFIGILAVVISLLFVGYELRLSRSIALSAQRSNASELTMNLHEFIAENPNVWARGCMDEELDTDEAIVFTNMVQAAIYYNFSRFQQERAGFSNAPIRFAPSSVASNIYNFPGFAKVWEKTNRRGSGFFIQSVIEEYELLIESGDERILDVTLCGG